MKIKYFFFGFLFGLIVFCIGLIISEPNTSVVFKATKDIEFYNGILVPKGTKLVQVLDMPEGFYTVALYINIWGGEVEELFDRESRKGGKLILPYWIEDELKID